MNQNIASNIQMQEKNDYNDSANYSNPTPKIWFFISYGNWFLSKTEKQQVQGSDSWFNSPSKISQAINRPEKIEKIDLSKIEILVTKDPELLQQYYDLREREYRNRSGFTNYSGAENYFDRNGKVFLGVFNGKVVAGARLVVSSDVTHLPHENSENNFTYPEICKELNIDLNGVLYSEISSLTISREIKTNVLDKLFNYVNEYCRSNNVKYIFAVADMKCSRDYKRSLAKIGVPFLLAKQIIAPRKPEFNNIDAYLIVGGPIADFI